MAVFDLRGLQLALEKKEPKPLYLLFGDESYLLNEATKLLKNKSLDLGAADFNSDIFYAGEADIMHVRDTVETLPMMAKKRFVMLKGAEVLKDKDWEILIPLFESPVETCVFAITCESVDKRKKAFKKISETGVVVELNRPYENQIPAWIEYIAQQNGIEVSREARSFIQQFVGLNLAEINNEIVKLRDYLGERKKIEGEDVLQVVSRSKVDSIFDLTKAIGRKDRVMALMHLANLLEQGQNEIGVVSMIARHVRILSVVREGLREGVSGQKLSAKAGVPNFFLKDYIDQARQWGEAKIDSTMSALYDTDKALKSSPVSSHIWLENFVIKTCDF